MQNQRACEACNERTLRVIHSLSDACVRDSGKWGKFVRLVRQGQVLVSIGVGLTDGASAPLLPVRHRRRVGRREASITESAVSPMSGTEPDDDPFAGLLELERAAGLHPSTSSSSGAQPQDAAAFTATRARKRTITAFRSITTAAHAQNQARQVRPDGGAPTSTKTERVHGHSWHGGLIRTWIERFHQSKTAPERVITGAFFALQRA